MILSAARVVGLSALLSALSVAAWTAPAAAQALSDEPTTRDPKSASAAFPKRTSWYGYQTFAPDAVALTVFLAAGDKGDSPKVAWTLAGLYLLGAPTVHALHRQPGTLAGSLAVRLMLPFLGLGIGAAVPCHQPQNSDEGCSMGGAFIGFGVGLGVAVILDSAWLAWDRAAVLTPAASNPRAAPAATKVSLSPAPLRGGAGLVLAGLF